MLSFEQARQIILKNIAPAGVEQVGLLDAVGQVLAHDMVAPWDMPLGDNSAMDGDAVRSGDGWQTPGQERATGARPAGAGGDVTANGFAEIYGDYGEIAVTSAGKTIAVWGEGFSYTGPGGTWFNVQR